MDRAKTFLCVVAIASLSTCARQRPLIIGSKNSTEQAVLGEIVAQHAEHRLSTKVARRLNLGGTLIAHQALITGNVDLYPEYTGTALTAILKLPPDSDPARVFERVRYEYRTRSQIEWLEPLGFNNSFAMAIRGEDARAHKLETLSDAAGYKPGWVLGIGYEFFERPDGYASLMRAYSLPWIAAPKSMDFASLYRALTQKQISMVAGTTTDGWLSVGDIKVLRDDKAAFPPSQAALAVRADTLAKYPSLRQALEELSGKFSEATMQKLNYQVDVEHRPAAEVASGFLRQAGLLR